MKYSKTGDLEWLSTLRNEQSTLSMLLCGSVGDLFTISKDVGIHTVRFLPTPALSVLSSLTSYQADMTVQCHRSFD